MPLNITTDPGNSSGMDHDLFIAIMCFAAVVFSSGMALLGCIIICYTNNACCCGRRDKCCLFKKRDDSHRDEFAQYTGFERFI